ncbi:hypothetical protein GQ53DRAFT_25834 [Thozetella sp. PMI_491]|nr:hypothetical protein GQ53DRAFT_25834 [Thozetella sp. PMI_491]
MQMSKRPNHGNQRGCSRGGWTQCQCQNRYELGVSKTRGMDTSGLSHLSSQQTAQLKPPTFSSRLPLFFYFWLERGARATVINRAVALKPLRNAVRRPRSPELAESRNKALCVILGGPMLNPQEPWVLLLACLRKKPGGVAECCNSPKRKSGIQGGRGVRRDKTASDPRDDRSHCLSRILFWAIQEEFLVSVFDPSPRCPGRMREKTQRKEARREERAREPTEISAKGHGDCGILRMDGPHPPPRSSQLLPRPPRLSPPPPSNSQARKMG